MPGLWWFPGCDSKTDKVQALMGPIERLLIGRRRYGWKVEKIRWEVRRKSEVKFRMRDKWSGKSVKSQAYSWEDNSRGEIHKHKACSER